MSYNWADDYDPRTDTRHTQLNNPLGNGGIHPAYSETPPPGVAGNPAVWNFDPAQMVPPMSVPPVQAPVEEKPVEKKKETRQDKGEVYQQAVEILAKIAAHELTGVLMYNFFALTLPGPDGIALREVYGESRDESMTHYAKAINFILHFQGGREYATPVPSEAVTRYPNATTGMVQASLLRAIEHEDLAISLYSELYMVVRGCDIALEDWAMEQVQTETEDATQFRVMAGLL